MTKEQSKQEIKRLHDAFIRAVRADIRARRYPQNQGGYSKLCWEDLQKTDPKLFGYLRNIKFRKGESQFLGEVDHIIPQSIWTLLMTGFMQQHVNVISNLWVRDDYANRTYDQPWISRVLKDHANNRLDAAKKRAWIAFFLAVKNRDVEGYPWVPMRFSSLSRWETEQLVADLEGNPMSSSRMFDL